MDRKASVLQQFSRASRRSSSGKHECVPTLLTSTADRHSVQEASRFKERCPRPSRNSQIRESARHQDEHWDEPRRMEVPDDAPDQGEHFNPPRRMQESRQGPGGTAVDLRPTPHGMCRECCYTDFGSNCDCAVNEEAGRCCRPRATEHRVAVSAEACGQWNDRRRTSGKVQVYGKCDAMRSLLSEALTKSEPPLAAFLEDIGRDHWRQILNGFRPWRVKGDQVLIRQGECLGESSPGLFILEAGKLEAVKATEGDPRGAEVVKEYWVRGAVFGELAVLHGAPRAATIVAVEDSFVWSVDRYTVLNAKHASAEARRTLYNDLLSTVTLLEPLGDVERALVIDALLPMHFRPGETIIEQGAAGNEFYIMERGEAVVKRDGVEVQWYERGSCFGELALLYDQPRAASVIAVTNCECASLDRDSFNRLLGPLHLLRKKSDSAKKSVRELPASRAPRARDEDPGAPADELEAFDWQAVLSPGGLAAMQDLRQAQTAEFDQLHPPELRAEVQRRGRQADGERRMVADFYELLLVRTHPATGLYYLSYADVYARLRCPRSSGTAAGVVARLQDGLNEILADYNRRNTHSRTSPGCEAAVKSRSYGDVGSHVGFQSRFAHYDTDLARGYNAMHITSFNQKQ